MKKRSLRKSVLRIAMIMGSVCLVLASSSSNASAGDGSKVVLGWIWQGDSSHPVNGATVVIRVYTSGDQWLYTAPAQTTGSDGWYSVTITSTHWNVTEVIKVTASYGEDQRTNSTTITKGSIAKPLEWVNVTFPTVIPQIVGPIGTILAGSALGTVAVVALRRRTKLV